MSASRFAKSGAEPELDSYPGTPLWIKAALAFLVLLIVVVVVLAVTGAAGEHGPGRHTGSGDGGGQTPPPGGHAP